MGMPLAFVTVDRNLWKSRATSVRFNRNLANGMIRCLIVQVHPLFGEIPIGCATRLAWEAVGVWGLRDPG